MQFNIVVIIHLLILLTNVICQLNNTKEESSNGNSTEAQPYEEMEERNTRNIGNVTGTFFVVSDNETNGQILDIEHEHGSEDYSNKTLIQTHVSESFSEEWNDIPTFLFAPIETVFMSGNAYQTYSWDKSKYTPDQYQLSLCGKVCKGEETVYVQPFDCPTIHCFHCICDRPRCEVYGICCPDDPAGYVFPDLHKTHELGFPVDNAEDTQDLQVSDDDLQNSPSHAPPDPELRLGQAEEAATVKCASEGWGRYLYIQSCPRTYKDFSTRNLCEQETFSEEDSTLDSFTRVTNKVTGIIYRNIFCALCNEVIEHIQWEVKIECTSYMYVYSATTMDQLLNYGLQPDSRCTIVQSPPIKSNTRPVSCYDKWISTEAEGRCNVTGLWAEYDEDVERACLSNEGRSYRVQHNPYYSSDGPTWMYKNIFCAICNMRSYPQYGNCMYNRPEDIVDREQPSIQIFSFLLGFGSSRRALSPMFESAFTFSTCKEGQWSAPDGSCMDVLCSPGKVLESNSCVTALDQIRGLSYNLQLWLIPSVNPDSDLINISRAFAYGMVFDGLFEQIILHLFEVVDYMTVDFGFVVPTSRDDGGDRTNFRPPVALWISALVDAKQLFSRDWLETYLITNFTETSVEFNFSDIAFEYQTLSFPKNQPKASDVCLNPGSLCYSDRINYGFLFETNPDSSPAIKLNKLLNCPFVVFNETSFETTVHQDTDSILYSTTVILKVGEATLNFSQESDLSFIEITEDGSLKVCRETLDLKLTNIEEEQRRDFYENLFVSKADEATQAQYYMTLVCLSVSMLCLLLTLLTYLRFRSLRSAAGMNNIFLCTSLLLAQAALLTSVHLSGPRTLCTVVGILTHFLWLWMFVWSFICCFHMFRVFTAKTRNSCSHRSLTTRFIWTLILSITAPALIVVIVISSSHFTSGGSRIGYGHSSCYLDSSLLIGLATVLTLCLVSVANVTFFSITVATIHKVRKLQSHDSMRKDDRRNLYIYVKLSTMTGAFWLIQIVAEAVDLDVLRYVAIILNGSQGTFIFFSYIWNKRVLNLYLHSLGFKPITMTSSGTQRKTEVSTLGALASIARKAEQQTGSSTVSIDGTLTQGSEMGKGRRASEVGDRRSTVSTDEVLIQESEVDKAKRVSETSDQRRKVAIDGTRIQESEDDKARHVSKTNEQQCIVLTDENSEKDKAKNVSVDHEQAVKRKSSHSSSQSSGVHSERDGSFNDDCDPVEIQALEIDHDELLKRNHNVNAQLMMRSLDIESEPPEKSHDIVAEPFEKNNDIDPEYFEGNHDMNIQLIDRICDTDPQQDKDQGADVQPFEKNL